MICKINRSIRTHKDMPLRPYTASVNTDYLCLFNFRAAVRKLVSFGSHTV